MVVIVVGEMEESPSQICYCCCCGMLLAWVKKLRTQIFHLRLSHLYIKWLNNSIENWPTPYHITHVTLTMMMEPDVSMFHIYSSSFVFSFNRCTFKIVHWVKLKCTSFVFIVVSRFSLSLSLFVSLFIIKICFILFAICLCECLEK